MSDCQWCRGWEKTQEAWLKREAELEAEVERLTPLAKFGEAMLEKTKDCISDGGFEVDAEDMANEAVALGIIKYVTYDPDKHIGDVGEVEPGDKIYWWGTT